MARFIAILFLLLPTNAFADSPVYWFGAWARSLTTSGIQARGLKIEKDATGVDTISILPPAGLAASYSLTLPVDDGVSGEVLATNGSGVLSWASAATIPGTAGGVYSDGFTLQSVPFASNSNKVFGVNTGETAMEAKDLVTGTSGTDFAIAHSAGTVTFNLPDASATARGAVTTGAQTFAGVKTFSAAPSIGDASGIVAATASVPGVVTTTSQTFAGAKTFSSAPVIADASGIVVATGSVPGVVSTSAQTFAGAKTFSGAILASDGTVGAPSVAFSSDADGTGTGLYRVGANSLGFAANGVNVGQYSSAGAWTLGASGGTANQSIIGTNIYLGLDGAGDQTSYLAFQNSKKRLFIGGDGGSNGGGTIGLLGKDFGGSSAGGQVGYYAGDSAGAAGTNGAHYFYGYPTAGGSITLSGLMTGAGAWTLGKTGSFTSSAHTMNGGLTINGDGNTLILNKSTTPAGLQLQSGGSPIASIGGKTGGGIQFYQDSTTEVGSFNTSGAWTLGNSTADVIHQFLNNSTTKFATFRNYNTSTSSDGAGIAISKGSTTNTSSQVFVYFLVNDTATGSGQINANGASQAAFGAFSDARLKKNIENLPSQLDNILALRPVEFDYIKGGHQIGFIAQEMEKVYPDAVSTGKDDMLMITGWDKTAARLVKAIQELKAELDATKAELRELKKAG